MWNCRGLGNPCTVQELSRLVREKDPLVLFVVETGLDEARLEALRVRLGFHCKLGVYRREQGGGLALFWKQEANIQINSYSHHHIDSLVNAGMENSWRFTGFYGYSETQRHHESWSLLRLLHQQISLPWCCVGDYNELTSIDEKVGGAIRSERQMQDFRDAIDFCGFIDLGFVGEPFTWCNNRLGSATIWERLDRGLATAEWISMFPNATLHHVDNGSSDHCPLWLRLEASNPRQSSSRRPFRFEEVWLMDPGCKDLVSEVWGNSSRAKNMSMVHDKIRNCRRHLRSWSKVHFANITRELNKKRVWLKEAESLSKSGGDHTRAKILKGEVTELFGREEKMWRQRSRNNWLRSGDRNTRFFHQSATQRRRHNYIERLHDKNGVLQSGEVGVAAIFLDYFQNLFQSTNPSNIDPMLSGVKRVVTREMNENLVKEFSACEVIFALKQMAPTTAPGPDGMPPLFYQSFWDSIGSDVTNAVLSCLNSGKIPQSINHTYITLIPKVQTPTNVTEFRPISLCNVIYKLISKVLANRLKKILPSIISETQSAFVPGRLITDNILVAFESLHHMSTQR